MSDQRYFEMNRAGWDQRAKAHFASQFYDVDGFVAGHSSLREIEREQLTDVAGKRMLHLQCNFGLDTLSWARCGAICTGVDISPVAIRIDPHGSRAGSAGEARCRIRLFRCLRFSGPGAPLIRHRRVLPRSYGTICWLPDLRRWADIVASNLSSGGRFYMAEFHPIYDLLAGYSYFTRSEPDVDEEGTYTENGTDLVTPLATWAHPLSNVINALIGAGIQIEQVQEYPFSPYNCFENMQEREPGRFYLSHKGHDVPIIYSIQGRRTGGA